MSRLVAFVGSFLLALPALAGPELQVTPGYTTDLVTPEHLASDGGFTLRLALGWDFRGHAVALGWRGDPFRVGSTGHGSLFASYRSPALPLGRGFGLVGLASVRDARFSCAPFSCVVGDQPASEWHRFPLVSAGVGVTIPFAWLLVVPALELGAAFPGTWNEEGAPPVVQVERMVVPAATVSFVVRHDPEAAGVNLDGLSWVPEATVVLMPLLIRPLPPRVRAQTAVGLSVALGVSGDTVQAGVRADLFDAESHLNGVEGPAVEGYAGMVLGHVRASAIRGTVSAGMAIPERCTSETCERAPEPVGSVEALAEWPGGGFEGGLRLFVDYDRVREAVWLAPGFVLGWSWR